MRYLLYILLSLLLASPSWGASTIWDFDNPGNSGTTWTGWTFYGSGAASPNGGTGANGYNAPGWLKQPTHPPRPATFAKMDYGNVPAAEFVVSPLPVTNTQSALRVYDTGGGGNKQAAWTFWHENNYGTLGLVTSSTNRISFYAYLSGVDPGAASQIAGTNGAANFEFSTFLNWPGGSCGDPNEACNQHYYHYFNANSGAWLHFQPDNRPTWQRNAQNPAIEPAGVSHPYFSSMTHFYLQTGGEGIPAGSSFIVGDISAWEQPLAESAEICNLWVGYWPGTGKWELGLTDCGIYHTNASSGELGGQTKFEVRWSTSPITNANWSSANTTTPEYHRFGATNSFRRSNAWYMSAWTRFDLPAEVEANNNRLYFAVKETSAIADGDYRNPRDSNIKTIDYQLAAAPPADTTSPSCSAFATASTSQSLTVPISAWDCTDNTGVTGWYLSESPNAPGSTGWLSQKPTSFVVGGTGTRTIYAWVRDTADNRSAGRSSTTVVTEDQAPPSPGSTKMGISGKTRLSPVGLGVLRFQ